MMMAGFDLPGVYPDALVSDKGGECSARIIKDHLMTQNCVSIISQGLNKASHVERFQRTLQVHLLMMGWVPVGAYKKFEIISFLAGLF